MRIQLECKKGIHGKTEHGVYKDKNGYTITRCLECAKDYKKLRQSNPEKKKQDREYTNEWRSKNKKYVRDVAKFKSLKEVLEKRELVTAFLKKEKRNRAKSFFKKRD